MRRGYCIGGPLHGQVMGVKHGASMIHAPTGARYGWVDGQWIFQPSDVESFLVEKLANQIAQADREDAHHFVAGTGPYAPIDGVPPGILKDCIRTAEPEKD